MKMEKQVNGCKGKQNIAILSVTVLIALFALDIMLKGAVYKRLPISVQNRFSEWIGR